MASLPFSAHCRPSPPDAQPLTPLCRRPWLNPLESLIWLNRGPEQRQDKRPARLRRLEQDADAIILPHCEDYYEPESERSGETDRIIAKHRNGPTDTVTLVCGCSLSPEGFPRPSMAAARERRGVQLPP